MEMFSRYYVEPETAQRNVPQKWKVKIHDNGKAILLVMVQQCKKMVLDYALNVGSVGLSHRARPVRMRNLLSAGSVDICQVKVDDYVRGHRWVRNLNVCRPRHHRHFKRTRINCTRSRVSSEPGVGNLRASHIETYPAR